MTTDIPLKIRVGIRDQWESPRAPIRHSIDALTKALGRVIAPQVEWSALYGALKTTFAEPSTFVPAICRIAIAFYGRLLSRIENEGNSEWTVKLLEEVGKVADCRLLVDVPTVDEGALQRPRMVWDTAVECFRIQVPKRKPAGNSAIEAGFDEDLDAFFGNALRLSPDSHPPPFPTGVVEKHLPVEKPQPDSPQENQIDVPSVDSPEEGLQEAAPPVFTLPSFSPISQRNSVNTIFDGDPSVNAAAKPGKLFDCIAPYVLVVDAEKVPLRVQASHQPSLERIATYLKNWGRVDQKNYQQQPLLKIEMIESIFLPGVFDVILIEPSYSRGDPQLLNPTIILSLVEGVLGYKEVFTNGSRWVFKLDPEGDSEISLLDRNREVLQQAADDI